MSIIMTNENHISEVKKMESWFQILGWGSPIGIGIFFVFGWYDLSAH